MGVYVTIDPPAGESPVRHLDLWCAVPRRDARYLGRRPLPASKRAVPQWTDGACAIGYMSNSAKVKAQTDRCHRCFVEGGPLPLNLRWDDWRRDIEPGKVGVYDLYDQAHKVCQVGSGVLLPRIAGRFRATYESRFARADCVWWLYDLLARGEAPGLRILDLEPDETPLEAEQRWREQRLIEGWQVSSLV